MNLPSLNFTEPEKAIFKLLLKQSCEKTTATLDLEAIKNQHQLSTKEWNYVSAKITKAIYEYLSGKLNSPEVMPSGYPLARYFREKGLDKNYRTLTAKLEKNLRKNGYSERTESYYRFLLQYLILEDDRQPKKKTEKILDYQNCFDNFYFENKVRIACELLNRGVFVNLKSDPNLLPLLSNYATTEEEQPVALRIYLGIYEMYSATEENEKHYEKVKELFAKNKGDFSPTDQREIYEFLMNFCIVFVNGGVKYYADEYLNFIKKRESENLILLNKKITESKLNNMVSVMLMNNELQQAEQFISKYAPALEKSIREHVTNFNLAQIEFQKGNIDKAHDLIRHFEPSDFFKKLKYDKLLLKIYFEKGEFELLKNKLKTFKIFLKKNKKLSDQKRQIFSKIAELLLKLSKNKPTSLEELKEKKLPPLDFEWFKKMNGL